MSEDLQSSNPSAELVSSFVNVLDISDIDYTEENELHAIRNWVVKTIRYNKDLESKVSFMDLKIGLLIRNHLSAQEIITQTKKKSLKRAFSERFLGEMNEPQAKCGNSDPFGHSKESQRLLDAYQHLFYLLQTDPRYMGKLICSLKPGCSDRIIYSIISDLYNYGATPREQCLMLQVFANAVKEEIETKVDKLPDVTTSTSMVFKLILNYSKAGCGLSCLRELLQPVIEMVINDEMLLLSTDPVEVYKHWINEQEVKTGQMVNLPYTLPPEQAEKVPEVIERIEQSIQTLKNKVSSFVDRIVENDHLLPYGICYIAKVLYNSLKSKFTEADELEIMKCVGNMLYYRYIIASIPAADSFSIIRLPAGKFLQPIQRMNLAEISKVLQYAAAFQLFEPTNKLCVLNQFLLVCHNTFLNFLRLICSVDEPELFFNMDAYAEATLLTKPEISLSVEEISHCHELLTRHREQVTFGPNDVLHELLDGIGSPAPLKALSLDERVTLSLSSRFSVREGMPALDQLLTNTKHLVIYFLQCQSKGQTLLQMLRNETSPKEEANFQALKRETQEILSRFENVSELKSRILHHLVQLELAGYVSSKDGYQALINCVATNIVNRNTYREQRKLEIEKLRFTLLQVRDKTKYYEDTLDYYSEYIQNCLQSLGQTKKGNVKRKTVKYTGTRLLELGVLQEIVGMESTRLKYVNFEISTTNLIGVFCVGVQFFTCAVQKVDVDIQHLLQLQYEGETVVELFDRAKVNVNLLVYLLNKKFLA